MQELWDLFEFEELAEPSEEKTKELLLALSHDAQMGSTRARTIQFHDTVIGQPVVVLVDSGCSASFLAESVASKFSHLQCSPLQASVKIANGHLMR
jgi:hypothetical protein